MEHSREIMNFETGIAVGRQARETAWNARGAQLALSETVSVYLNTLDNPHTRRAKQNDLGQWCEFLAGNNICSVGDLGQRLSQEIRALLEGFLDGKLADGLKVSSVQRKLATLRQWYHFLHEEFPHLVPPLLTSRNPRYKFSRHLGATRALTLSEWFRLKLVLEQEEQPSRVDPSRNVRYRHWKRRQRLHVLCHAALLLGGRRLGELLQLRWDDIDWTRETVALKPLKAKGDQTVYSLPLHPQLKTLLEHYRELWAGGHPEPGERLFDLSPQAVDESLKRYGKLAGIGSLSFHVLRTTFITWALERGDSLSEILNCTLHKSSRMIRYYDRSSFVKVSSIHRLGTL
ncbi:MAG: tyrosine-type recombinase/integrase [SAR324 cluster bacterium]|nr:tyrosine-type recombinase/integrase [SAR324 cluster bacterium]